MKSWLKACKSALRKPTATMIALSVCAFTTSVFANPVLDNVAAGNVTVQQTQTTTTINQQSQKAILNWQSFNIGAQEHTHFQQPVNGVALNRINPSQGVSQIYGRLTATGQIILVNPAGFHFGPSAYVNVGGLIASTANISNDDFLNDYYRFVNDASYNGFIHNQGQLIAAEHGLIALIGGAVRNDGMIQANMGTALLASGDAFTMSLAGYDLVHFSIDKGVEGRAMDYAGNEIKDGVRNTGTIMANGGRVLVSAKAAAGVLDHVINMEGIAEAKSVHESNGEIILFGDLSEGVVRVAGTLDASDGGHIETSGHVVQIEPDAKIIAGELGSWLLDPPTVYLSTYGSVIQTLLSAGTDVTISTGTSGTGDGDVFVDAAISWATDAVLMLGAYRNIEISEAITASNNGGFIARADLSASGTGTVNFSGSGSVTVNGANGYAKLYYNPTAYSSPTNYSSVLLGTAPVKAGYMMIHSLANLQSAATAGSGSTSHNYAFTTDIDGSSFTNSIFNSNVIGNLDGHDYATGLNHVIYNLSMTFGSQTGTIGLGNFGITENLGVTTCVLADCSTGHGSNVLSVPSGGGGFYRSNEGTLSHVFANVIMTGPVNVAGLAIFNGLFTGTSGIIKNSYVAGTLTATNASSAYSGAVVSNAYSGSITDTYNTASLSGNFSIGGIAGAIQNNFSGPAVFTNVYNAGSISPASGSNNGAIVGFRNSTLNITGAYWDTTASSPVATACGNCTFSPVDTPLTSAQMLVATNFPTFDFVNTWTTNGDTTAPQLIQNSRAITTTPFTGTLGAAASGQSISVYADNTLVGSATADAAGTFVLNVNPNTVFASNPAIIMATASGAVTGDYIGRFHGPAGGFNIVDNQVTVRSDTGVAISNTDLAAQTNSNYIGAAGNNLSLTSGASLLTLAEVVYSSLLTAPATPLTLNGNISTTNGSITLNGDVTISAANPNLITNTSGDIIIAGDVAGGGNAFTVSTAGSSGSISGVMSNLTNFYKAGSGLISLSGANTYTGDTNINAGTLRLGAAGVIADASDIVLANVTGALFDTANFDETVGAISGGGANGGNIIMGAGSDLTTKFDTVTSTYSGSINNGGNALYKDGTGELILNGNNASFTGQYRIIGGGKLTFASNTAYGSGDVIMFNSAGSLEFSNVAINAPGNFISMSSFNDTQVQSIITTGTSSYNGNINFSNTGKQIINVVSGSFAHTGNFTNTLNHGDIEINGSGAFLPSDGLGSSGTPISSLVVNNPNVTFSGDIYTQTNQTYNQPITLGGDILLNTSLNFAISLNAVNLNSHTLTVDNKFTSTASGTISGTGSLVKSNTGSLTVSGANTYSGSTSINGGTLVITNDGNLGTAPLSATPGHLNFNGGTLLIATGFTINSNRGISLGASGGTLNIGSGTQDIASIIAGTGGLTKSGAGAITLSGANTYSGGTTITTGDVAIGSNGALGTGSVNMNGGKITSSGTGTYTLGNSFTLNANTSFDITDANRTLLLTGLISGGSGFIKDGPGTVIFTANNTYTNTTINNGILQAGNGGISGTVGGGTLVINSPGALHNNESDGTVINNAISGDGDIVRTFGGTLSLTSAANTLSGTITMQNGSTLQTLGGGTLGTADVVLSTSSSNILFNNSVDLVYSGNISGPGYIQKYPFSGPSTQKLTLSGNNTLTGGISMRSGILSLTSASAAPGGTIYILGGQIELATNDTIGTPIDLLGNIQLSNSNTFTPTYSGNISGGGSIEKVGNGTLTLTGSKTYTGSTTISEGSLSISANNNLGSTSNAIILNGGTLETTAGFTNSRNITLTDNSAITSTTGNATYSGTMNGGYSLTLNGAGDITLVGNIGSTTALSSLVADAALNSLNVNTTGITTSGNQTYNEGVLIGADTNFTTTAGSLSFNSSLNDTAALTHLVTFTSPTFPTFASTPGLSTRFNRLTFVEPNIAVDATLAAFTAEQLNNNTGIAFTANSTGIQVTSPIVATSGTAPIIFTNSTASQDVNIGANISTLGTQTYTSAPAGGADITVQSGVQLDAGGTISFNNAAANSTLLIDGATIGTTGKRQAVSMAAGLSPGGVESSISLASGTSIVATNFTMSGTRGGNMTIGSGLSFDISGTFLINPDVSTTRGRVIVNGQIGTALLPIPDLHLQGGQRNLSDTNPNGNSSTVLAPGSVIHATNMDIVYTRGGGVGGGGIFIDDNWGPDLNVSGTLNMYADWSSANAQAIVYSNGVLGDPGNPAKLNNVALRGHIAGGAATGVDIQAGGKIYAGGNITIYDGRSDGNITLNNGSINPFHTTGLVTINGGNSGVAVINGAIGGTSGEIGSLTVSGVNGITLNSSSGIRTVGNQTYQHAVTLAGDTLVSSDSGNITFSGTIGGTGDLIKDGAGTLTLSGANTFTSQTVINDGVLAVNAIADEGVASPLGAPTGANSIIDIGANGTLRYTGGAGSTDRVINFTGDGGTVESSGTGSLTLAGNVTGANNDFIFTGASGGTVSGDITNTDGTVTITGGGTWTFSGNNTFGAGASTIIDGATLSVASDAALGCVPDGGGCAPIPDPDNILIQNGGILEATASFTIDSGRGITLGVGGGAIDVDSGVTLTVPGVITGSTAFSKTDTGTLILSGANTMTGSVTASAGTLQLENNSAIGSGNTLTISSGATALVSGNNLNIPNNISVTGTGASGFGAINNAVGNNTLSGTITLAGNSTIGNTSPTTLNISGNISGANELRTAGGGTLHISSDNAATFSGNTFIDNGITRITHSDALGTGAITVNDANIVNGGTLLLSNNINVDNAITIKNSGESGTEGAITSASGASTISGTLTVAEDASVGAAIGDTLTISGSISSSGNQLTLGGGGIKVITGNNTLHTGDTSIQGGRVQFAHNGAFGSGTVILNAILERNAAGGSSLGNNFTLGANAEIGGANNFSITGALSGAGNLTKSGDSEIILWGANSFTGATVIENGILRLTNTAGLGSGATQSSSVTVENGGTLAGTYNGGLQFTGTITLEGAGEGGIGALASLANTSNISSAIVLTGDVTMNATANLYLGGNISDGGNGYGITKIGNSMLRLAGSNTYTGVTVANAGTLRLWSVNALGSDANMSSSTTIADGATLNFHNFSGTIANTNNMNIAGAITSNANNVVLSNPITLTDDIAIGGTHTFTISGVINDGGNNYAINKTGSNFITMSGESTYTGGTTNAGGTLRIGSGGSSGTLGTGGIANSGVLQFNRSDTHTVSNVISGTGSVTKNGAGTTIFTGANTYSGSTTISAGTLQIGNGGATGNIGSGAITNNSDLAFNRSGSLTFSDVISGTGTVTQASDGGTLTLSGANTYSGGTVVNDGILVAANATSQGSGAITVNDGGTLRVNNGITISNAISLDGAGETGTSGALEASGAGTGTVAGAISLAGNTTIGAATGSTLDVTGTIDGAQDLIITGPGGTDLSGAVGGTTPLTALTANTGIIISAPTIDTTGTQTFNNGITLAADSVLTSTGGNVIFGSTVNGANNLSVTATTGNVSTGTIGNSTPLDTLNITAGNTLNYTGNVTTVNNQTYTGFGRLFGHLTFATGGGASSAITFNSRIVSTQYQTRSITANAGAGSVFFGDSYGGTPGDGATLYPSVLNVTAGTEINFAGPYVGVVQNSTFNGPVVLSGNVNFFHYLPVRNYTFNGTVDGTSSGNETLTIGGGGGSFSALQQIVTFNGAIGSNVPLGGFTSTANNTDLIFNNAPLTVNGNVNLSLVANAFTGEQPITFDTNSPINVTGNVTLSTPGSVTIGSALLATGSVSLTANNGFDVNINDTIGSSGSPVASVTASGTNININTNEIFSSGNQTYSSATTLGNGGDITLTSTGGGVNFGSSVTGDNNTLIINNAGTGTISGVINDTSLTKQGAGTLILTGNNTYTGTTLISAGTLQVGNGGTSGQLGTGTITDNSNLSFNRSDTVVVSGAITGTGSLTQAGSGTVILSDTNNYTGGTTISNGTLQVGNGGASGTISDNILNNSALVFNTTGSFTYSDVISGTGSVTQQGDGGVVTFTNANTYTGGTTVSDGILAAGNNSAFSTGTIATTSGGTIRVNNGITLTNAISLAGAGETGTSGALEASGAGTATVSTGGITLAGDASIGAATGSTLDVNTTIDGANALTINGPGAVRLLGAVGSGTALSALTANITPTILGGTVETTGNQTYNSSLVLGNSATFTTDTGDFTVVGNVAGTTTGTEDFTLTSTSGDATFGGALGSAGIRLKDISINASTASHGGDVRSNGTQTYNAAITLTADVEFDTAGNTLTFGSTIDSDGTPRSLIVRNGTAYAYLNGNIGATSPLASFQQTNANPTFGIVFAPGAEQLITTGAQSYNSQMNFAGLGGSTGSGGPSSILLQGSTFSNGGPNGINAGTQASPITMTFTTMNIFNTTFTNGNAPQTYNGAINIFNGGVRKATFTSGGLVTFNGPINHSSGGRGLLINGTGPTIFNDTVGATTAIPSIEVSGPVTINTTTMSSVDTQLYSGAVTLSDDVVFSSTNNNITFNNTINGAQAITVTPGSGNITFNGVVGGSTPLTTITANGTGTTNIGADITTSGTQTYNNLVTLTDDIVLTSSTDGISLVSNVTSDAPGTPRALTLTSANPVILTGNLGTPNLLNSLTITNDSSIGATISTVNAQNYNGPVTLTANSVFNTNAGGTITFADTIGGGFSLTANASATGAVNFNDVIGSAGTPLTALTVTGDATFANGAGTQLFVSGAQTYNNDITFNNVAAFTLGSSGSSDVILNGAVESLTTPTALSVLGDLTFNSGASIGQSSTVASLNVTGTTTGTNVTTAGDQTYNGAFVLTDNDVLTSTGGNITFNSTINGDGVLTRNLTVDANGTASLNGTVGGTNPLGNLTVTGAAINIRDVTTVNDQTYNGPVSLALASTTLNSSAGDGNISINGTLEAASSGNDLVINTGAGAASFSGDIGQVLPFGDFTNTSTGATTFGGALGRNGAWFGTLDITGPTNLNGGSLYTLRNTYFRGPVTLGADMTIRVGAINFDTFFNSTIDGLHALNFISNSSSIDVNFNGDIGGITPLASLSVNQQALINTANITTSGAQTYSQPVQVNADTTLTSTGSSITFGSTFNGSNALTIDAATTATLRGTNTAESLEVTAPSGITVVGTSTFTTSGTNADGNLIFNSPVTANLLGGQFRLNTTNGGRVEVNNVTGQSSLIINAAGGPTATATLMGSQGGGNASSTMTASGGIIMAGNALSYQFSSTFNSPVTVTAPSSVSGSFNSITFNSTIDGPSSLTINPNTAGGGGITISNAVGSITPLSAFTITGANADLFINAPVSVTGAFNMTPNANFGSGSINFTGPAGTTITAGSISATAGDGITIDGYTINTTGNQIYNVSGQGGIVSSNHFTIRDGNVSLNSSGGSITFSRNGTVATMRGDGVSPRTLDIDSATGTSFNIPFATTNPIGVLDVTGPATINTSPVNTSGTQTFNDNVTLSSNASFTTTDSDITFAGTINGARTLTTSTGTADLYFSGAVGNSTALTSVTTNGTGDIFINGGSVRTSGVQTYNNVATLGADTVLTSTGNAINLLGNVTSDAPGTPRALTLTAASPVTLSGQVGSPNLLSSLTITNDAILGATINTVGAQSYNGAVTLNADSVLNTNAGGTITFAGTVDGAFNLTANPSAGTVNINGLIGDTTRLSSFDTSNALTVNLNGGGVYTTGTQDYTNSTLTVATSPGTLDSSTGGINLGAVVLNDDLTVDNETSGTASGIISGAGSLTKDGNGTLIFTANNTYTGTTTISNGTIQLGNNSTAGTLGTGTITNNGTLAFNRSNAVNFTPVIAGTGSVEHMSTSSLTLSGVNTYSGNTILSGGGTLYVQNNSSLGTSTFLFNDGTLRNSVDLLVIPNDIVLGPNANMLITNTLSLSGLISGSNGFTLLSGGGTKLEITNGSNTYTGDTIISSGSLRGSGAQPFGIGGDVNINGGNLIIRTGGLELTGIANINFNGSGPLYTNNNTIIGSSVNINLNTNGSIFVFDTLTLNAVITDGLGTFGLTLGGNDYVLNSANTFDGNVSITADDIYINDSNAFGTGSIDIANTGVRFLTNTAGINIDNNIALTNGLTVAGTQDSTISGVISGAGALVKTSANSLTLSGDNTFTGGTSITSGTVRAAHNDALGTGTTTIATGSTLQIENNIDIFNPISVSGTGAAGKAGAITANGFGDVRGSVTLTGDATFGVESTILQINDGTVDAGGFNLTLNVPVSRLINMLSTFSNGSLTKEGVGTATVGGSGINNYSGPTSINNGTLIASNINDATFGTSVVTVANGATLQVGNTIDIPNNIIINGPGFTGRNGALESNFSAGTMTVSGLVTLGSDASIGTYANTTLNLTNTGNMTGSGFDLTYNGAGNASIASNITTGTGGLITNGTGTLTLTGTNTYSGATSINSGILQIGNNTTTGTLGTGQVNNNAALVFDRSNQITANNVITGTGSVTQNGSGELILGGASTYSGKTFINDGILTATTEGNIGATPGAFVADQLTINGGTLRNAGNLVISTNRGVTIGASGATFDTPTSAISLFSNITGPGSFTKTGIPGSVTITGNNTFAGDTFITQGTVAVLGTNSAFGDSSNVVTVSNGARLDLSNGVTLSNDLNIAGTGPSGDSALRAFLAGSTISGDVTLTGNTSIQGTNSALTISGDINDGGNGYTLTHKGNSTTTLTGANTYSGGTTIQSGTLQIGDGGTTGILGSGTVANSGTLTFNRSNAYSVSNLITGSGTLSHIGSGTTTLSASNTYTGNTSITNGILQMGSTAGLGSSAAVNIGGSGTLDLNDFNTSVNSLTGSGAITLGTADLTIGADNSSTTFSGVISETGNLIKSGTGTIALSGNSTYTGDTTINAGTLGLGAATNTLPTTTDVSIATGANFDMNGNDQFIQSISGAGNLLHGSGGDLRITGNNSTTFSGNITGDSTADLSYLGTGTLTLSGGSFTGFAGQVAVDTGTIKFTNGSFFNNGLSVTASNNATIELEDINVTGSLLFLGISDSTLKVSTAGANASSIGTLGGNMIASGNSTIDIDPAVNLTISTFISGTGSIDKTSTGILTLSGANTYSGTMNINAGTIVANNNAAMGTTAAGTTINNGGTLQIANGINLNAEPITMNTGSTLSGTGNSSSSGLITLGGDATFRTINGGDNFAVNGTIDGANTATFTGPGDITIGADIGGTTPLTSISVNSLSDLTFNSNIVNTTGSQDYSIPLTFGADTSFSIGNGSNFSMTAGTNGAAQDVSVTGTGSNTYTFSGGAFNTNSITVNGTGGGNTLAADSGAAQTWNVTGADTGDVPAMSINFNSVENLTGTNNDNTFIFSDGASVSGTIDAQSLADTNTLDFSAYTTPVTVDLTTVNDGMVENNASATIVGNFLDITHVVGSGSSLLDTIELPTGATKGGLVDVTGVGAGSINDPIFYNGFYTFVGDPAFLNTNAFTLPAGATVISSSGGIVTANVGGVTMTFINFLYTIPPAATPIDVAPIIGQPDYQLSPEFPFIDPDINIEIGNQIVFNTTSVVPIFDDDQVFSGPICTTFSY